MAVESQEASQDSLESQYDAKIHACFAEIRRLREARNADCSRTRKLPREVLAMIFGILAQNTDVIKSYPLPYQIRWVVVTHVCSAWRNTALSEPRLWTDLSGWTSSSSRWVNELFVRSKAASLSLSLACQPSAFYRQMFDQMLQVPERFKSLSLSSNEECLLRLTKPMPSLERLWVGYSAVIPDDFAGGSAPRLRHLELFSVVVPMNAPWFSNVRTLSLTGDWSPADKGRPLSVKSFVAFLSRLPRLVDLNVQLPKAMDATILPPPGDVTTLALESWKVYDSSDQMVLKKILQYIAVHALQRLEVKNVADSAVLDAINFFMTNTRAKPDTIRWKGNEIEFIISTNKRLSLRLFVLRPAQTFGSYVSDINIKTLQLVKRWAPTVFPVQDCHTIEELRVDADDAFETLMQLKSSDITPLPYPSLRCLVLQNVVFTPKTKNIARFREWLSERKKVSGLKKLVIKRCGLNSKEIALLAKTISVDVLL